MGLLINLRTSSFCKLPTNITKLGLMNNLLNTHFRVATDSICCSISWCNARPDTQQWYCRRLISTIDGNNTINTSAQARSDSRRQTMTAAILRPQNQATRSSNSCARLTPDRIKLIIHRIKNNVIIRTLKFTNVSMGGNIVILLSHKINFCKLTRFRIETGICVMLLKDRLSSARFVNSP